MAFFTRSRPTDPARLWIPPQYGSILALALVLIPSSACPRGEPHTRAGDNKTAPLNQLSCPPVAFIENRGQTDGRVLYYTLEPGGATYLLPGAIVRDVYGADVYGASDRPPQETGQSLGPTDGTPREWGRTARRSAVWKRFVGANPSVRMEAASQLPGRSNFVTGRDPSGWHTGVPTYGRIVYRNLWAGIDLVCEGDRGSLKETFIVHPGADPGRIGFLYEGAEGITIDENGCLRIDAPAGAVVEERPLAWTGTGKAAREVPMDYRIRGDGTVGFSVGPYDRKAPLTIDPGLIWAARLGGAKDDRSYSVALDSSGNILMAGWSQSAEFPTGPGAWDSTHAGVWDVFVAKIDPSGRNLIWSTFLGGASWDKSLGLVVDDSDNPVVVGWTKSAEFPTTPGVYDSTHHGDSDIFVTKLDASGSGLLWSTLIGGRSAEACYGVCFDSAGNLMLGGWTRSRDFPTTPGAYAPHCRGRQDGFVAKMDPEGRSLLWSTFVGGRGPELVYAFTLDPDGNPVIGGWTISPDFPTTQGAHDTSIDGSGGDAFVAKIDSSGSRLLQSTLLGGSAVDRAWAVAFDAAGNMIVAGRTQSPDFPTTPDSFGPSLGGGWDSFAAKFTPEGVLLWSTYLGGGEDDLAWAMILDSSGNPILTGRTLSREFPTTPDAYDASYNGNTDAFLAKLDASGSRLLWSSFLGGSELEEGYYLALDDGGHVILVGETWSADFPAEAAWTSPHPGRADAFVARFDLPTGP